MMHHVHTLWVVHLTWEIGVFKVSLTASLFTDSTFCSSGASLSLIRCVVTWVGLLLSPVINHLWCLIDRLLISLWGLRDQLTFCVSRRCEEETLVFKSQNVKSRLLIINNPDQIIKSDSFLSVKCFYFIVNWTFLGCLTAHAQKEW